MEVSVQHTASVTQFVQGGETWYFPLEAKRKQAIISHKADFVKWQQQNFSRIVKIGNLFPTSWYQNASQTIEND